MGRWESTWTTRVRRNQHTFVPVAIVASSQVDTCLKSAQVHSFSKVLKTERTQDGNFWLIPKLKAEIRDALSLYGILNFDFGYILPLALLKYISKKYYFLLGYTLLCFLAFNVTERILPVSLIT